MHATPLPPPVAQGSSSHTPQKRSAETLVEEPSAESETARRNRAGNKKLKLALYGRDDELFGAGKSLPDDMQKCQFPRLPKKLGLTSVS